MSDREEARRIHDLLARLIHERARLRPGGHLVDGAGEALDLRLRWPLRGAGEDPDGFARSLEDAVDRSLEEVIARRAALRPGLAFCHACGGPGCEHSEPPSARHVLERYEVTGQPRWTEFSRLCLERRHADTDRLFGKEPAFITWVHGGDELAGPLPTVFRDAPYRLLGQVLAGFYDVAPGRAAGRSIVALTIQVATLRGRGAGRPALNLIARTPDGEPVETLWDRQRELPWHNSLRWAQAALQTIRPTRAALDRRVAGILGGVARRLRRDRRARHRRTRHAEDRHASRERPTRKAFDDLVHARIDTAYVDEARDTLVILGERGRAHVFAREGLHVTSVRYRRDAIQRKVRHERWRPASPDELELLRKRVADREVGDG